MDIQGSEGDMAVTESASNTDMPTMWQATWSSSSRRPLTSTRGGPPSCQHQTSIIETKKLENKRKEEVET